jgi:signal transduction histidine kinase
MRGMPACAVEQSGADDSGDGRGPIDTPTVLVVDDYPGNRLALQAVLDPLGYAIVTAASGAEALRLVHSHDFVLILMDVQMPDLDGYATTALIRQCERGREVPIVFLTAAYDQPQHTRRGYALGAVDYISKPFDDQVLRAKVRALVSLYVRGRRLERERSEQYERLRDLFLGAVSHDLRNPVGAITMRSALIRARPCPDATHAAQAAAIERAAGRIAAMLDDLLELVRSQYTGHMPVALGRSDLGDVCRSVLGELRLAHPMRTLELAVDGDVVGQWDAHRLARAVSNLVSNALEHGDGSVRVGLHDEGDAVTLDVCNRGKPISNEALPTLFEPFRSGDGSRGWGLGLYIVREIVRAHGGQVRVASATDETVFTVRLPKGAKLLHEAQAT